MTKMEQREAEANYLKDKDAMMQLFLVTAKELGYPQVQDWPDTKPMEKMNDLSAMELARTEAYQETLGRIMLGAITSF